MWLALIGILVLGVGAVYLDGVWVSWGKIDPGSVTRHFGPYNADRRNRVGLAIYTDTEVWPGDWKDSRKETTKSTYVLIGSKLFRYYRSWCEVSAKPCKRCRHWGISGYCPMPGVRTHTSGNATCHNWSERE